MSIDAQTDRMVRAAFDRGLAVGEHRTMKRVTRIIQEQRAAPSLLWKTDYVRAYQRAIDDVLVALGVEDNNEEQQ